MSISVTCITINECIWLYWTWTYFVGCAKSIHLEQILLPPTYRLCTNFLENPSQISKAITFFEMWTALTKKTSVLCVLKFWAKTILIDKSGSRPPIWLESGSKSLWWSGHHTVVLFFYKYASIWRGCWKEVGSRVVKVFFLGFSKEDLLIFYK